MKVSPNTNVEKARMLSFCVAQELSQTEIERISGAGRRSNVLTPIWAETGEQTYEVDE